MTTRLLAFVLAVFIGSPTCWCCVPHEPVQAKPAGKHACCHQADDATKTGEPQQSGEDKCPCALSQVKRDVATDKVAVPPSGWNLVPAVTWQAVEQILPAPTTELARAPRADESPPLRAAPLYKEHCALLL